MPHTVQTTVPVQNLRKGDVTVRTSGSGLDQRVTRETVDAVKRGTKWVEARDADGKLIVRLERGMGVLVERVEDTPEEREAGYRAYAVRCLTELVEDWATDPTTCLRKSIAELDEQGGAEAAKYGEVVSHWTLDTFLTRQAGFKLAVSIRHMIEKVRTSDSDFYAAATDEDEQLFLAVGLVLDVAERRQSVPNPLSRSTSVTSNLYEDLDRHARAEFIDKLRWTDASKYIDAVVAAHTAHVENAKTN